ncbi:MAG TPA: hypothetical protein VHO48_07895 [Anaerolineaceae bacterium]|nr:hypothetical protein [Anaerolineaceae bacterium]
MSGNQGKPSIWARLFKRERKVTEPARTAPLPPEQIQPLQPEPVAIEPAQLIVGTGQSIGKERDHNEDSLFTMATVLSGHEDAIPFGLFIIADGMGGYQNGEIASNVAARAVASEVLKKLILPYYSLGPIHRTIRSKKFCGMAFSKRKMR